VPVISDDDKYNKSPLQEEAMQIHRLSESRQLYIFQSRFHIEHRPESIEIIDIADDALSLLLRRFADHEIIDLRYRPDDADAKSKRLDERQKPRPLRPIRLHG
jgi:hypothetical protein